MSDHALSLVNRNSKLKKIARIVLMVLAQHARDDGSGAFPSVATIQQEARCSRRSVQYAFRRAREADELEIVYNFGPSGTNCFRVRLETLTGPGRNEKGGAQILRTRDLFLGVSSILLALLLKDLQGILRYRPHRPRIANRRPRLRQTVREHVLRAMAT